MKVILKSPTLDDLNWCTTQKGCLFPVNQGSLFFAHQLEKLVMDYGLLTQGDLDRKKKLESILKYGFFINQADSPLISESVINTCYQIVTSGICCVDVDGSIICPTPFVDYLRPQEKNDIEELQQIRAKILYFSEYSYEALLERMYNYFLLTKCVLKLDRTPVFDDIDHVLKTDPAIISTIFSRFVEFRHYIPESIFRAISRGDGESGKAWNSLWHGVKSVGDRPFKEWDENRINLCRWTDKYESIRSMPDAPSEDIICNDFALDNWLFSKKLERKSRGGSSSEGISFENRNQEQSFISPDAMTFETGIK
jgi:hypothetical protein